jgi:hypothetical protein
MAEEEEQNDLAYSLTINTGNKSIKTSAMKILLYRASTVKIS